MSGGIDQAMYYTVTFSQCLAFEIYKCLPVFSERITVTEEDVCRHPVPSLDTKTSKNPLSLKCIVCQGRSTSLFITVYSMAANIYIWFAVHIKQFSCYFLFLSF